MKVGSLHGLSHCNSPLQETLRDSGIQCFRLGGNLLLLLHAFVHDLVTPFQVVHQKYSSLGPLGRT